MYVNHGANLKVMTVDGMSPRLVVAGLHEAYIRAVTKVAVICGDSREVGACLRVLEYAEIKRKYGRLTRTAAVEYDHGHIDCDGGIGTEWTFEYPFVERIVDRILECKEHATSSKEFVTQLELL
jgi:hypothetical protein